MSKLNPNAQKWVEALRSGKYKQAQGALKEDGNFCCLGVLCDLAIKEGIGDWDFLSRFHDEHEKRSGRLPKSVMKWAGVKDSECVIDSLSTSLTMENDNGVPFAKIADLIEKHADELFVQEQA